MSKLPLSKSQLKIYKEIKEKLDEDGGFILHIKKDGRYEPILKLIEESGCVRSYKVAQGTSYMKVDDLEYFEQWLKDKHICDRKMTFRDWKVVIATCTITGVLSQLPKIMDFFINIWEKINVN